MFTETYTDITVYPDDGTSYYGSSNTNDIIQKLSETVECLFSLFPNNYTNKWHFKLGSNLQISLCIQDLENKSSKIENFLTAHIDHELTFETHVKVLCKKT